MIKKKNPKNTSCTRDVTTTTHRDTVVITSTHEEGQKLVGNLQQTHVIQVPETSPIILHVKFKETIFYAA